ncbi:hypothetical protein ACRE_023610 [Hapsidospora chrysogenum ATCC 11550]|uniref:Uncharacterized protein n=1 Tax=Hapsidospora chrysogenum (strain ATCC 11550 / CBS 779.69 / DSM 880 / IAM 14645 / JCM 23072 / IMI 49137) TaxID=857340 RepID=A0A086TBS5_HAPC1|nr:hypothetical protein ACRE_023610 [Hapsidospora chrysogenum ATCC 11550]
MAAIHALVTRDFVTGQLVKRKSWPAKNVGVMVVFVIVGIVGIGLITLWVYKYVQKRKAAKQQFL